MRLAGLVQPPVAERVASLRPTVASGGASVFELLGRLVVRWRFVMVAGWLVAAAILFFAPSLRDVGTADETSFLPRDVESVAARQLLAQGFPQDDAVGTATLVLLRDPGPLTDADRAYLREVSAWMTDPGGDPALDGVVKAVVTAENRPERTALLRSEDGTTEIATIEMTVPAFQERANDAVAAIREHLAETAPDGLAVHVTGQAGIGTDYLRAIADGTDRTTVVTIVLVVLILLAIYRAPLAALVPLITIGAAFLVARGLLGWLAQLGWSVSTLIDSFIVVLVFGVGTDYTIFLISRYREELGRIGAASRDVTGRAVAARVTVGRIGAVITASAATVVVGLSAMVIARFGMIQTTGPALAIAIVVALAAGLTLAPSLLVLFGPALFWPRHPKPLTAEMGTGVWDRVAAAIVRRPLVVSVVVVVAMAIPILLIPGARTDFDTLAELPAQSDARQGFDAVAAHMDKGRLMPMNVAIETPGLDLTSPEGLATFAALGDHLAAVEGVGSVRSLVDPTGEGVLDELRISPQVLDLAGTLGQVAANPQAIDLVVSDPATLGRLQAGLGWLEAVGRDVPAIGALPGAGQLATDLAAFDGALQRLAAGGLDPAEGTALRTEAADAAGRAAASLDALGSALAADPLHDLYLPDAAVVGDGTELARLVGEFVGPDGNVGRIVVVAQDDPYSTVAFETVDRLREALAEPVPGVPAGTTVLVGGSTAEFTDIRTTIDTDFRSVAIVTVIGVLLVLILLLRSLVAPVFLVATVLLSYGTTLHLAGGLFEGILGHGGMNYFLPLLVFVLLVALGSDYNIFVVSRIREESARRPIREGIRIGAARTGTVITSAGIILAGTFAALMTAPLEILFQVGAAVALGVLLDTFVVRSLLVPALIAVFGDLSWWPSGWVRRRPAGRPRAALPSAGRGP
jgi:RND superfamily putative drug exporter